MKVLYDSQIFDAQKIGGISRYFYELMGNASYDFALPVISSQNEYLQNAPFANLKENTGDFSHFLPSLSFRGKRKLFDLRNKLLHIQPQSNRAECVKALQEQDFDVFHPTYFDPYFLPHLGGKPFVLTVYDFIHEKYPEFMGDMGETIANKKLLIEKAAKIIAISQNTKDDLREFYGDAAAEKTTVIHLGSSLRKGGASAGTDEATRRISEEFGKYILFTGSRNIYKNFLFTIESCADFLRRHNLNFVCTGTAFSAQECGLFDTLGISDRVFCRYASDAELFELYKNAWAFIFPSYYEGFGIPILESFEAGTPCLLANASCFVEIAADAALYFEPKSKSSMLAALEGLLEEQKRAELSAKGRLRLAQFSWQKTAGKTAALYEDLLEQRIML